MTYYIYTLNDPIDFCVKYVGKTRDINLRLIEHLKDRRKSKKQSWIKSLSEKKLKPSINVIEICNREQADFREIYWINFFNKYLKLKNMTSGGTGGKTYEGRKRKVKNNLGEEFSSIKEAAIRYNISESNIINCCKNKIHFSKGIRWAYSEEQFSSNTKKKITKIVCCSNGKAYSSALAAAAELNLPYISIRDCLSKRRVCANSFQFWYLGSSPSSYKVLGKRIYCITNNKFYNSSTEAAKELGLCNKQISQNLNKKQNSVFGYSFIFANEIKERFNEYQG